MSTNRFTTEPTFTELLAGVASGARDLASAHAAQLRAELCADARRGCSAAVTLASGGLMCILGSVFMLVALVHVLIDVLSLTPWAAWLTVGGLLAIVGAILIATGVSLWKSYQIVPDESIRSMGESVSWITSK